MGIIITKFRKKKTTYEVLEKLENEIQSIEEFGRSTEQTQKKMVGRFIFISICVYSITALIFYFYFFPSSAYERIIYIIPLIILPMLLIFIKRILSWYYNSKITKNQKKLTSLKDEKKKILEEVMDKETYKVAKTILEKFAPEQIKKNPLTSNENTPIKSRPLVGVVSTAQSQTTLRYRGPHTTPSNSLPFGTTATPKPSLAFVAPMTPAVPVKTSRQNLVSSTSAVSGTPLLLPRAILPRDRSVLDKMVDYLVGDGPSNRYALICKNCSSHNGMALKEEFDYLSFRCCYCGTFNPARKKRLAAPKLETPLSIKDKKSDISDSEKHSFSDSDSESDNAEPIITEAPNESQDDAAASLDKINLLDLEVKNSNEESSAMDIDTDSPFIEDISSKKCDLVKETEHQD